MVERLARLSNWWGCIEKLQPLRRSGMERGKRICGSMRDLVTVQPWFFYPRSEQQQHYHRDPVSAYRHVMAALAHMCRGAQNASAAAAVTKCSSIYVVM